jgi:hypothetical protein
MPATFAKIQTVSVGAAGSTGINFTSIPQTYDDLCVFISARCSSGTISNSLTVQPNGQTTNQKSETIRGNDTNKISFVDTAAGAASATRINGGTSTAGIFSAIELYVSDYSSTSLNKIMSAKGSVENNAASAFIEYAVSTWASTAAITSLNLYASGNTMIELSTATLYGIKRGNE